MFQRILVALDNSVLSDRIFDQALALARSTHANLMLLHILSDEEATYPAEQDLDAHLERWQTQQQLGQEQLQIRWAIASEYGIKAECSQMPGAAPSSICTVAQSWHADLIVVGQRELSAMQRLIRGSVSNYVLHRAPCSVMTVHAA